MADDVVVYFVGFKGTLYACSLVSNTYVGISSMDRYGAIVRKLDWANIPWKNWDKGEPSTMEEFGVLVRDANAIDYLFTSLQGYAQDTRSDTMEIRRLLAGMLGYGNQLNGELAHTQLMKATPWQCLQATDDIDPKTGKPTGAMYAIGPKVFFWINSLEQLGALWNSGVMSRNVWPHTVADIQAMRDAVMTENTDLFDPTRGNATAVKSIAKAVTKAVTTVDAPPEIAPLAAPAVEVEEVKPFLSRIDPDDPKLPSTLTEALELAKVS